MESAVLSVLSSWGRLSSSVPNSTQTELISFVFNLMMLGILYGQVWHWFSWGQKNKERIFIKTIVVSVADLLVDLRLIPLSTGC